MRVALIGFGKWGRNYLSAINQSGIARVTQVLVRNPDRIIADPLLGSSRVTSNLEEIECDAVIVATHPSVTVGYAVYFLRKNIPVMLEKPAGLSLDDTLLLQRVADEHPVPLLVSHQHLFSSVYQELKKRVNAEEVMEIETAAGNNGPYRDYSFIWDYAPHDVAMILGLKQMEVKLINAITQSTGEYCGQCVFSMAFEDGSKTNTKVWNDRFPKERKFVVKVKNNCFIYDDQHYPFELISNGTKISTIYTPPLTNAVAIFLRSVWNGRADDYRFGAKIGTQIAEIIEKIHSKKVNTRE
jgi:predicted dehydrogenase